MLRIHSIFFARTGAEILFVSTMSINLATAFFSGESLPLFADSLYLCGRLKKYTFYP